MNYLIVIKNTKQLFSFKSDEKRLEFIKALKTIDQNIEYATTEK